MVFVQRARANVQPLTKSMVLKGRATLVFADGGKGERTETAMLQSYSIFGACNIVHYFPLLPFLSMPSIVPTFVHSEVQSMARTTAGP